MYKEIISLDRELLTIYLIRKLLEELTETDIEAKNEYQEEYEDLKQKYEELLKKITESLAITEQIEKEWRNYFTRRPR